MTTQSNPSPFSSDAKIGNAPTDLPTQSPQADFELRTMKDDLAKLQSGGIIEEKAPAVSTSTPFKETLAPQPKQFDPSEITSEKINSFSAESFKPAENIEKIVEIPTENSNSDGKPAVIKIIMAIIVVLVIAIIGLGAYYFLLTKKNNQAAIAPKIETPAPEPVIQAPAPEPEPEVQLPKYSADKPNYLTIDINNLEPQEIKESFVKISNELKDITMPSPYEFSVVDNNNNPISFPIFATAAKINLSPELLNSLGSDFSVYFYNDNSKIRLGLSIAINNKEKLTKELPIQEKTFINDASFLFLNNSIETKNNPFATSPYGKYSVRFSNTNANKDLSIDYAVTDSKLTIGTSKNTERALLDKLDLAKTTPAGFVEVKKDTSSQQVNIPGPDSF